MSDNTAIITLQEGQCPDLSTTTMLVPILRAQLMAFLFRGGNVAEIGVAQGGFARLIFDSVQPARMHLIDLWESQDQQLYPEDGYNRDATFQNSNHASTVKFFSNEIANGRVQIHRGYSHERAYDFPDQYFDWIHVDANHTYDAVLQDLESYAPKVKHDGLIAGHDFSNHAVARKCSFGVIEAARDFCLKHNWALIVVTTPEDFPTYILARRPIADRVNLFALKLLYGLPGIIEVTDFFQKSILHEQFVFSNGRNSFSIRL